MTLTNNHINKQLIKSIKEEPDNYDKIMCIAASGGYMHIVKLMLEKGAIGFNETMVYGATGGYMDIVELMLEKGANDYNASMGYAAHEGHIDIVKLMIEKGANDHNWAMSGAAECGYIDIVKLMLEKGADDYNKAMIAAAYGGHIDIIKIMLEKGATSHNQAMRHATAFEYYDIAKLIRDHRDHNKVTLQTQDLKAKFLEKIEDKVAFEVIKQIPENEIPLYEWQKASSCDNPDTKICTMLYNSWTANPLDKYIDQIKSHLLAQLKEYPFNQDTIKTYDKFHDLSIKAHTINANNEYVTAEAQLRNILDARDTNYNMFYSYLSKIW